MDYFISHSLDLLFNSINAVGQWVLDVAGYFGSAVVLGSMFTFIVYRLIIKPLTGYGVGSDSARPKKDEKGE